MKIRQGFVSNSSSSSFVISKHFMTEDQIKELGTFHFDDHESDYSRSDEDANYFYVGGSYHTDGYRNFMDKIEEMGLENKGFRIDG